MFEKMFSQSQQFMAGWGKLWQDQLERFDAVSEDAMKLQEHGAARTSQAIDELAKLGKASVEYANRLNTEWRRVGIEAWRRTAEMMTPDTVAAPSATPRAEA
ncbi:hypothetical protein [Paraliomyxa miuraensis]|uniref:hypothetical protein n=1 Tax=Paraliomyxa miuraensis TaxID=376150 RepID=UPI00224D4EA8|nr:hypothetical protein [Paraliomyxa miuraensis]MCX4244958.1 hypothetical protein [Paraliomyxa miuraensis]